MVGLLGLVVLIVYVWFDRFDLAWLVLFDRIGLVWFDLVWVVWYVRYGRFCTFGLVDFV